MHYTACPFLGMYESDYFPIAPPSECVVKLMDLYQCSRLDMISQYNFDLHFSFCDLY